MKKGSITATICCVFIVEELYNKLKKRFHENAKIEELISILKKDYPAGLVRNYRTIRNRLIRLSKDYFMDDLNSSIQSLSAEHEADPKLISITEIMFKEYGLELRNTEDLEKELSLIIFGTC